VCSKLDFTLSLELVSGLFSSNTRPVLLGGSSVLDSKVDSCLSSELGSILSSSNTRPILLGGLSIAFSEASRRVGHGQGRLAKRIVVPE
jgi:hypothetical protein